MRKLPFLFFVTLVPVVAMAEPTPSQLKLGQELASLLKTQSMFEAYLKHCSATSGAYAFDPKSAFKDDPGSFGGVSPQSSYWPEVEELYRAYQKEVCAYLTPEGFQSFYAQKYAEHTSEADLQAAVAFYSSLAGRRLQQSSVLINEAFQIHANELLGSAYRTAYKKMNADLRALIRKYQHDPK